MAIGYKIMEPSGKVSIVSAETEEERMEIVSGL